MAKEKSKKVLRDEMRAEYLEKVIEFFKNSGEEVLKTASNEFCIPCVDKGGNENYLVVKLSIPSGSRDGEPYDGYSMAESYALKVKENAEKAEKKAKEKAEKQAKEEKAKTAKAKNKSKGV